MKFHEIAITKGANLQSQQLYPAGYSRDFGFFLNADSSGAMLARTRESIAGCRGLGDPRDCEAKESEFADSSAAQNDGSPRSHQPSVANTNDACRCEDGGLSESEALAGWQVD